jgi:acetoin utilization protein AcuB
MKIRSLMIAEPITITEKASILDALDMMKMNAIRHLPVIDNNKRLKGFVILTDLKLGLIPALAEGLSLTDLMIKDPVTIDPDFDVEVAAQYFYKHKISGMPVVKDKELVGIITETDILRSFIDMMGILTGSSRIDVVIGEEPDSFGRAAHIITDNNGDIINVGIAAQQTSKKIYYFRLLKCNTRIIKMRLKMGVMRCFMQWVKIAGLLFFISVLSSMAACAGVVKKMENIPEVGDKYFALTDFGAFEFEVNSSHEKIIAVKVKLQNYKCGPINLSAGLTLNSDNFWSVSEDGQFSINLSIKIYKIQLTGYINKESETASGDWEIYALGSTCKGSFEAERK